MERLVACSSAADHTSSFGRRSVVEDCEDALVFAVFSESTESSESEKSSRGPSMIGDDGDTNLPTTFLGTVTVQ